MSGLPALPMQRAKGGGKRKPASRFQRADLAALHYLKDISGFLGLYTIQRQCVFNTCLVLKLVSEYEVDVLPASVNSWVMGMCSIDPVQGGFVKGCLWVIKQESCPLEGHPYRAAMVLNRIVAEFVASETLMNRLYNRMNDIISLTMMQRDTNTLPPGGSSELTSPGLIGWSAGSAKTIERQGVVAAGLTKGGQPLSPAETQALSQAVLRADWLATTTASVLISNRDFFARAGERGLLGETLKSAALSAVWLLESELLHSEQVPIPATFDLLAELAILDGGRSHGLWADGRAQAQLLKAIQSLGDRDTPLVGGSETYSVGPMAWDPQGKRLVVTYGADHPAAGSAVLFRTECGDRVVATHLGELEFTDGCE